MKNIQSFIVNVGVPKTLEHLFFHVYDYEGYVIDRLFDNNFESWTAPNWAKADDVVFFMHVKTGGQQLKKLAKQLQQNRDSYSQEEYDDAMSFLQRGLDLHSRYGGKIFAAARVTGTPYYYAENDDDEDSESLLYWKSRIYADMEDLYLLENPVDISEFRVFLQIRPQATITPVFGGKFDMLRDLIMSHGNNIPDYIRDAKAVPVPLADINPENWLKLCCDYRHRFTLESQFREFYVDYFLRAISDDGQLFSECRVKKTGKKPSFADNVIMLAGVYIPVEVKLNLKSEPGLFEQLGRYCEADAVFSGHGSKSAFSRVYSENVLVIDTEGVYLYDDRAKKLELVRELSAVRGIEDISCVRTELVSSLNA